MLAPGILQAPPVPREAIDANDNSIAAFEQFRSRNRQYKRSPSAKR